MVYNKKKKIIQKKNHPDFSCPNRSQHQEPEYFSQELPWDTRRFNLYPEN